MRPLKIHQKLSLIVLLLLLPLLGLTAIALNAQLRVVWQDQAALAGLARMEVAWAQFDSIASGAAAPASLPENANLSPEEKAAEASLWAEARDSANSVQKQQAAAARLLQDISTRETRDLANFPQFDAIQSFLAQDLAVLAQRSQRLADLAVRLSGRAEIGPAERMAFLVNAGQYKALADQVSRITREDLGEDASFPADVTASAAAYRKANSAFQKAATGLARGINQPTTGSALDPSALSSASAEFAQAVDQLWRSAEAALAQSIREDLAKAWRVFGALAGTAAAVLLGAVFLVTLTRRSILSDIRVLRDGINHLADQDLDAAVPMRDCGTELSDVADAVAHFRDSTVARISNQRAAQEAEAAARRAEMMGTLEARFGEVVAAAIDGDFSRRVKAGFDDAALNTLAEQVNALVAAFEHGLRETNEVMARLANADLGGRMQRQTKGAFLQLQQDINAVVETFSAIVNGLKVTSGSLKGASGEITAISQKLAKRSTEQRDAASRTSRAMEDMVAAVRDVAHEAQSARNSVSQAGQQAEGGRAVMTEASSAMDRVRVAAAKIAEIIDTIDGIAMQTDLLAINASVEASRAGEAGKGFSVVAQEVRELSFSTARASEEVQRLVQSTLAEIGAGDDAVKGASESFEAVSAAVRETEAVMEQIADRNMTQAEDLQGLAGDVQAMDAAAEANQSQVEKTIRAVGRSSAEISTLDGIVERFSTEDATVSQSLAS